MLYVKILSGDTVIGAEVIESPGYVKHQIRNNILVRCPEPEAQGIISKDGSTVYQLQGKETLSGDHNIAVPITLMEYDELGFEDTEDTDPVVPDEDTPVMTRAELTEKVLAMEDELAAAKILLGVV